MHSMRLFAPREMMDVLEENADFNNLPRIGVDENVVFPAVQLNLSSAVSEEECRGESHVAIYDDNEGTVADFDINSTEKGLDDLGEFGSIDGHNDNGDSAAGLTCMIANSRLPDNYEPGRFHMLYIGAYFRLESLTIMSFCGLHKHGGTPPISPTGKPLDPSACRKTTVCYPSENMLSGSATFVTPLASLPNGTLFKLGPEITSYEWVFLF